MATTIGRVEFIVGMDGKKLPADARKIGREAGEAGGKEFNKSFGDTTSKLGKELRDNMREHGELSGFSFSDSMKRAVQSRASGIADTLAKAFHTNNGLNDYAKEMGSVGAATDDLRTKLGELRDNGGLSDQMFNRLHNTLNQWVGGARRAEQASADLAAAEDEGNKQRRESIASLQEQLYSFQRNSEGMQRALEARRAAIEADSKAHERNMGILNSNASVMTRLRTALEENRRALASNSEDVDRNATAFDRLRTSAARHTTILRTFNRETANGTRGLRLFNKEGEKTGSFWMSLPHGVRQWTLIIGAIAAAGTAIAVLGSAAGSSLALLLASVAALGTGAIVAIAGFKGMFGELSAVEAAARPAAEALQKIKSTLGDLQNAIQGAMFVDMADSLNKVNDVLSGPLKTSLASFAGAAGVVFKAWAEGFSNTKSVTMMQTLLKGFEPVLIALGAATASVVGALGNIFVASLPYLQAFANGFATMMARFQEWTGSLSGQNMLAQWFENGRAIMVPLLDLLGEAGKMLASLVTPQTIAMTIAFIGNLSTLMPMLGTLLSILGELDVFGLLAAGLVIFGQALSPLAPALADLGATLGGTIMGVMLALAPVITDIATAIAPVIPVVADLAHRFLMELVPALAPIGALIAALVPLVVALAVPLAELAIVVLSTVLPPLIDFANWIADNSVLIGGIAATIAGGVVAFKAMGLAMTAVTVATKIWGAATAAAGALLAITPIGWIVIAIGALVAALVWVATQTTFFQDAWKFMSEAVVAAWTGLMGFLQPVFDWIGAAITNVGVVIGAIGDGIGVALAALGTAFTWLWESAVKPVLDFIGTSFELLWTYFIQPAIQGIQMAFEIMGALIGFVWTTVIQVAIDAMGALFKWLYDNVISPVGLAINVALKAVGVVFQWLHDTIFKPVGDAIGAVVKVLGAALKVVFDSTIKPAIEGVGTVFKWLHDTIFKPIGDMIGGTVDILGKAVGRVFTTMADVMKGAFDGVSGAIKGALNGVIDIINGVIGGLNGVAGAVGSLTGADIGKISKLPKLANGYLANSGAMRAIIGEAGPEAVVPLNRSLSQVDPSVRALSAFAQGLPIPGAASAGGEGRTINIEKGAIQVVTPTKDPAIAASQLMDRIVAVAF